MAESGATIVLDADTTKLIQKLIQAGAKVKDVKDESEKVSFSKAATNLGKMLITASAIKQALVGAADAMARANAEAGKTSAASGGSRLDRELNLQKVGLGANYSSVVENLQGGASIEDRDKLLSSLASGGVTNAQTAARAMGLGASGLFSNDEIVKAAKEGGLDQLQASEASRMAGLSQQAREELGIRSAIRAEQVATLNTAGDKGALHRLGEARLARMRAENPGAFVAVDALKSATALVGGDDIIDAGIQSDRSDRAVQTLEAIRQNTQGKLNLSAGGER